MMRECDGCTVCCTVKSIDELHKPTFTRCPNDCGGACAIYGKHPASCQAYSCLWLKEKLPEECKPDKCGVMLDFIGGVLRIYEIEAGALIETVEGLSVTLKEFPIPKAARVMLFPHNRRVPIRELIIPTMNGKPLPGRWEWGNNEIH